MSKRIFATVVLISAALVGYSQGKNKKNAPPTAPPPQRQAPAVDSAASINPLILHYLKKRDLAVRWGDAGTAKDALYDLIAETGNDSLVYVLALQLYESQQYAPTVLVCKDLLAANPKNQDVLELSGLGFEALGLKDKALPNYESLYMLSGNTALLYKISNLQYETKRYAEAKANVDILLTKPDLDKLNVNAPMADGKSKQFPVKVAILNLKGLLASQAGDKPGAKKAFEEALVIAADFPMAKENLAKLK